MKKLDTFALSIEPDTVGRTFSGLIIVFIAVFSLISAKGDPSAAPGLPELPEHHVLDRKGVLSPKARTALQKLLEEHQALTGERIYFTVLSSGAPGNGTRELAGRLMDHWHDQGKWIDEKSVHILVIPERDEAAIAYGFQLDPILQAEDVEDVASELQGTWADAPEDAAAKAVDRLLRLLDSPLAQTERAEERFQEAGLLLDPVRSESGGAYALVALLGLLLLTGGGLLLTSTDLHYSRDGAFLIQPVIQLRNEIEFSLAQIGLLRNPGGRPPMPPGGLDGSW